MILEVSRHKYMRIHTYIKCVSAQLFALKFMKALKFYEKLRARNCTLYNVCMCIYVRGLLFILLLTALR